MPPLTYPHTPTVEQVDDYHGALVNDSYRWLEDTESPVTRAWIQAQNRVTEDFLSRIPARDRIRRRLTELWNFPKAWAPVYRGGRYFQVRNTGLQNQDVLYVSDSYASEGRVLLDPNSLSEDGTVALVNWAVSPDGRWLAYATSGGGSDWQTWRVRAVETGEDLPDVVEWSKFAGAAWRGDSSGFYYAAYDAPPPGQTYLGANYNQKLMFHRLGDAHDDLVYARPDQPTWGFRPVASHDGRYLIINVVQGSDVRNRIFYLDLVAGGPVVELIAEQEATYQFVGNDGPVFYFRTNLDAPRARLIAIDTTQPDRAHWRTIIPEGALGPNPPASDLTPGPSPARVGGRGGVGEGGSSDTGTLAHVLLAHGEFVALYVKDAYHQLRRFDRAGRPLGDIPLPTPASIPANGNILSLSGEPDHHELFYSVWSFLLPQSVYRYDLARPTTPELLFAPRLDFATEHYVTRQVFVPSKDGTRVPLFLTHRRDLPQDGLNPTLLYGYGGFNIAMVPKFAVGYLAWLELGGVWAWANLRGGSEYGEDWHQAGMLANKQNVFDDFIACAEYLIQAGITSTPKLAMHGGSNGGLLVGAVMTQRPDLFGAAIPAVGVMDMLRFHKFTIGWAWVSDYGSADDPDQFQTLFAYSPLHNLKAGVAYPATLILTGDHDDRVVPGHSFKFAAALQAAQAGDAPVLIRVQTRAGHGLGKPTAFQIDEAADMWAFLVATLRL